MSSLKSWACSMEKNIAENSVNYAMSTLSQDNQYLSTNKISTESNQKQMLESLRDVLYIININSFLYQLIANIDSKLNTTDMYLN